MELKLRYKDWKKWVFSKNCIFLIFIPFFKTQREGGLRARRKHGSPRSTTDTVCLTKNPEKSHVIFFTANEWSPYSLYRSFRYGNFYLAIGSTFYGFINFERLSAMVYHENTQDHVKKTGLYFHIRGWPGYFGSGHAGLESLLWMHDHSDY